MIDKRGGERVISSKVLENDFRPACSAGVCYYCIYTLCLRSFCFADYNGNVNYIRLN